MNSEAFQKRVQRLAVLYRALGVAPHALRAAKNKLVGVELFAGSCGLTQACREAGIDMISIDAQASSPADVKGDVRDDGHLQVLADHVAARLRQGYMPVGHQSPPCNQASNANTVAVRHLDRTADYITSMADFMSAFAVTSLENPQARFSPLYMTSAQVVDQLKERQQRSMQLVRWPTAAQVGELAEICEHKVLVWYCMLGRPNPKPTLLAFNTSEAKQAFLANMDAVAPGAAIANPDKSMQAARCPHGYGAHGIRSKMTGADGRSIGAHFPAQLMACMAQTYADVAETMREAVAQALEDLSRKPLAAVASEHAAIVCSPGVARYLPADIGLFEVGGPTSELDPAQLLAARRRLYMDGVLACDPDSPSECASGSELLPEPGDHLVLKFDALCRASTLTCELMAGGRPTFEPAAVADVAKVFRERGSVFYAVGEGPWSPPLCALYVDSCRRQGAAIVLQGKPCGARLLTGDGDGGSSTAALVTPAAASAAAAVRLHISTGDEGLSALTASRLPGKAKRKFAFGGVRGDPFRRDKKVRSACPDDPIHANTCGALSIPQCCHMSCRDVLQVLQLAPTS